jgi:ABC-2 type transport system permease protein
VIYGALDIATALSLFWLLGLFLGISSSDLQLAPWASLAIGLFVVFNILLGRMIFAWIEHWLSRRRSREVLGVIFLLTMVGFQMVGPLLGRYDGKPTPQTLGIVAKLIPLEQVLPPGLAASCLTNAAQGRDSAALVSFVLLVACSGSAAWVLHLRLREQRNAGLTRIKARSAAAGSFRCFPDRYLRFSRKNYATSRAVARCSSL